MDLSAVSGTLSTHAIVLPGDPLTENEDGILLQLLKFKTHLLEALEELHIRRDTETRFEEQLSKLVLEKQELEWQKDALQHHFETLSNEHTESLASVKKQFQAKIRYTEEEKRKYQISAELKDKEINSLKDELKSLQLLKYTLERNTRELEQKLALQSRSKDSHMNQLGEVEKRVSALSRQCTVVKQAHANLEQNVDEAMEVNKKVASANAKQETTIKFLEQELEKVNNKLFKAKVLSAQQTQSTSGREQHTLQLQQKLLLETEMNEKLRNENESERSEKQKVMRSLQHAQQLLLSQTQTVSRVELELHTQKEECQALKREHEGMQEKRKAAEDRMAQLMEDYSASKAIWDKEKTVFLEHIQNDQKDLVAVKEAYDQLHQQHTELSSQAVLQVQPMHGLESEMMHLITSEISAVCNKKGCEPRMFSQDDAVMDSEVEVQESDLSKENLEVTNTERSSDGSLHMDFSCVKSSLTPISQIRHESLSLQSVSPSRGRDTNCHVATESVIKQGLEMSVYDQQPQAKEFLSPSNIYATLHSPSNLSSVHTLCGNITIAIALSTKHTPSSPKAENSPDVTTDLLDTYFSAAKDAGRSVSGLLSTENRSLNGAIEGKSGDGNRVWSEQEQGGKDKKQGRLEDIYKQDVEEDRSTREVTGRLEGRARTQEHGQGSTEYVRDTRKPEKETKDRAEGEKGDGEEKRGRTALSIQETEIPAQTSSDKNHRDREESHTLQAIDIDSQLADCSQSLFQTVNKNDADSSQGFRFGMKGDQLLTLRADENRYLSNRIHPLSHEVQCLSPNGIQTYTQDVDSLNQSSDIIQLVCEKTPEEKRSHTTAEDFHSESSEPLNQSCKCSTAALSASQSDNVVGMKTSETTDVQLEDCNPSNKTINRKNTEEQLELQGSQTCVSPQETVKPQETQEISEQENGQLKALESDSCVYEKQDYQSYLNLCENDALETDRPPTGKPDVRIESPLNGSRVDIRMDNVRLFDSQVETGCFQEPMETGKTEDTKTTKCEIDVQRSASLNDENDESSEFLCAKWDKQPLANQLLSNTDDSSLPSNKKYRLTFELHRTQRKTVTCRKEQKSDVSSFHRLGQGSSVSKPNPTGSTGVSGQSPSIMPMSLKNSLSKVPPTISTASDLMSTSSLSGHTGFLKRLHQAEWKAIRETFQETAAADTESRILSESSFPVSTSSSAVSRPLQGAAKLQSLTGFPSTPMKGRANSHLCEPRDDCSQK
ncbi:coiled-coil domain-containing protein 73 [Genypterus blacodes]|uniref:coiled-coil domain-containing protein 73 n=1 Tax=Genypterus blacodes TaxID=154954 RepID=UPI003F759D42